MAVSPANDDRPDWVTPTQWRYLQAVEEHGSSRKAEAALGLSGDCVAKSLRAYRREAARRGLAPGHFNSGVAPGNRMGKVTVQRNALGEVERTWERQHPDGLALDDLIVRCEERLKDFPDRKSVV